MKPAWRCAPFVLRLRRTFRIHTGASDARDTFFVAFEADGVTGIGEGAPPPRYGETVARSLALFDDYVARVTPLSRAPGAPLADVRVPECPEQRSLQMAVDLALYDWFGKTRHAPLHEILGVSPSAAPRTSFTLAIDEPSRLAESVREAGAFAAFKVKLGGPRDAESLAAVRRATDKPIRVDANEGWTPDTADGSIAMCAEMGVELVEQPLPQGMLEETARLRERSPVPLFADEDFRSPEDAARIRHAYHGVNVKMVKCGGIRGALEAIRAARENGLLVMLGCGIESSLGISAAVHLSALADFVDLDGAILTANDPAAGPRLVEGRLIPTAGAGLCVSIRDEELARALALT